MPNLVSLYCQTLGLYKGVPKIMDYRRFRLRQNDCHNAIAFVPCSLSLHLSFYCFSSFISPCTCLKGNAAATQWYWINLLFIALKSYPFLRKPVGLSTNRDDVAYFFLLAFAFLVLINCTTNFNVQTRGNRSRRTIVFIVQNLHAKLYAVVTWFSTRKCSVCVCAFLFRDRSRVSLGTIYRCIHNIAWAAQSGRRRKPDCVCL